MKFVVAVKQVPDTAEVRIDSERGTLIRDGVPSIMNPFDTYALEEAMKWRDELGGVVTVITMGPPQAESVLKEAISMGADDAILISDRAFAGADTWATSHTLAAAVKELGDVDAVFFGKQAIDGDTAQTGPSVAASLDWPQITFVGKVRQLSQNSITAERYVETGTQVVRSELPVVLTILKDANVPRVPSLRGKMKSRKVQIPVWGLADLALTEDETGLNGSPTKVVVTATPEPRTGGQIHEGSTEELVAKLADLLLGEGSEG
ncbi:MAG: electron transfer flavoprotein subunit beta/FixA family protein [Candidatus Sabulitectum sp.]|nr:electron transfer flavoprotein subunit beta/FixA family protein [Candidatus Sabulitectum sp.]